MRRGTLAGLYLAAVLLSVYLPQPCEASWTKLVVPAAKKLVGLMKNNVVPFLGRNCNLSFTTTSSNGKRYYTGTFKCRGWSITGTYTSTSSSTARLQAVIALVRKAFEKKLIGVKAVVNWLK